MHNALIIGGIDSRDYNVGVHGDETYKGARRSFDTIVIGGMNGVLTQDNGRYENVSIGYHCYLYQDFETNMDAYRSALLSLRGYQRIEDIFHPDEYRLGMIDGEIAPKIYGKAFAGEFDVNLNCKPQRFLKSGETVITLDTDLTELENPTRYEAKPIIRAYEAGSIDINGATLNILSLGGNPYIDIDCELMDCYYHAVNLNAQVEVDVFPTLAAGKNTIYKTMDADVEIIPRWWTI